MTARSVVRGAAALAAAGMLAWLPPAAAAADLTVDDRALKKSGSWAKVKTKKATDGTLSRSKKKGATLTTKVAATSGGKVIFQVGKGRGTATITVGKSKKKKVVVTSAKRTSFKTVKFSGTGAVKIAVSKQGGGVYVDAVVLTGLATDPAGGGSTPGSGAPGGSGGTTPGGSGGTVPGGSTGPAAVNTGALVQLDASAAGVGADGDDVGTAAISPNGAFVAFWSRATNLVPGVSDGHWHLYVKTLSSGAIALVDASQSGTVSNDGDSSGATYRGLAWKPDSTEILFVSSADNLGPSVTGSPPYLYAKSITDQSVGRIMDLATNDVAWSPDGTKIAFGIKGNLCPYSTVPCTPAGTSDTRLYSWTVGTSDFTPISADASGVEPGYWGGPNDSLRPVWSPDSKKVAFESSSKALVPGDTNVASDIFVKDVTTQAISRVSVSGTGAQGNGSSEWPAWSPDGTRIAFDSKADNFDAGDNNSGRDVFVKDLGSGAVSAISATPDGEFKLFNHTLPKWSPDGSKIAFTSESVDLIPGYVDSNQRTDIYVRTLATGAFQLISARADGVIGGSDSTLFQLPGSSGGWLGSTAMMFASRATNLANSDNNAFSQSLFLKSGL